MTVESLPAARERALNAEDLTYPDVGATLGRPPAGYHHLRRERRIGTGRAAFDRAAEAVLSWRVQTGAGLRVRASSPTAEVGTVLVSGIGVGPLRLAAPCRVVYVLDEPSRVGFGYGTLPGHPESGEESFVVELRPDDSVVLVVQAFSRHAAWFTRLAGPVGRLGQRLITERYLRAL